MIAESRFLIPVFMPRIRRHRVDVFWLGHRNRSRRSGRYRRAWCWQAFQRSLSWEAFRESLMGATRTSAMIALILMGAAFLSLSMGFTGLPRALAAWIDGMNLSPITLIAALTVFYIILGMFLDGISSVVLTMAIVEPMIRQAGIDVIWFGIFIVVVVEMAQVTPPIGFNLFVLQGMTKHEISYISKVALPMVGLMLLMVVILVVLARAGDVAAKQPTPRADIG